MRMITTANVRPVNRGTKPKTEMLTMAQARAILADRSQEPAAPPDDIETRRALVAEQPRDSISEPAVDVEAADVPHPAAPAVDPAPAPRKRVGRPPVSKPKNKKV